MDHNHTTNSNTTKDKPNTQYMIVCVYLSLSIYIYISISLSIYLYIYIYIRAASLREARANVLHHISHCGDAEFEGILDGPLGIEHGDLRTQTNNNTENSDTHTHTYMDSTTKHQDIHTKSHKHIQTNTAHTQNINTTHRPAPPSASCRELRVPSMKLVWVELLGTPLPQLLGPKWLGCEQRMRVHDMS